MRCNYAPQVSAAPCPEEARAVGSGRGGYYRAAGEGVCLRPPKCKLHTPETPTPPRLRPLPPPPGRGGGSQWDCPDTHGAREGYQDSAIGWRTTGCIVLDPARYPNPDAGRKSPDTGPGRYRVGGGAKGGGPPPPPRGNTRNLLHGAPTPPGLRPPPPPRGAGAVSAIPDGNRLMGVCTWDNRAFERSNSRTRGQVPMQGSSLGGGDRGGDRGGGPPPPPEALPENPSP